MQSWWRYWSYTALYQDINGRVSRDGRVGRIGRDGRAGRDGRVSRLRRVGGDTGVIPQPYPYG